MYKRSWKEHSVHTYLSVEDKERLRRLAEARGLSMYALVKKMVLDGLNGGYDAEVQTGNDCAKQGVENA